MQIAQVACVHVSLTGNARANFIRLGPMQHPLCHLVSLTSDCCVPRSQ